MNASRQRHMENGTFMWVQDRDHEKTPSLINLYLSIHPTSVSSSAPLISLPIQIKMGSGDHRYLVILQVETLKNISSLPHYFLFVVTCCWKSLPQKYKVCVTNIHCSAGRPASQELLLIHLRKKPSKLA